MELSSLEMIYGIAHAKSREQAEIAVVAHPDSCLPSTVEHIEASIPKCPVDYLRWGDGADKWATLAIESSLQSALHDISGYDLVHDQTSAVSVAFSARRFGIPLIRTLRLLPCHPAFANVASLVTHAVFLSNSQLAIDEWHSSARRSVIHDCVPLRSPWTFESPDGLSKSLDLGSPFAISVGRVEPRKGHHKALALARTLSLPLRVVGPVTDDEYARELGKSSDVTIIGELDKPACLDLISRATVLLWTPSIPEPGGRVVIEALRLGTSVVGYATGALGDIVSDSDTSRSPQSFDDIVRADQLPSCWPDTVNDLGEQYWQLYFSAVSGDCE